jgi:hypothetical protein
MPSQVLTTRRVKRRQQRLRLVSKNAKRKVRSVRKHRKTAKKVMRGGLFENPTFFGIVYDNLEFQLKMPNFNRPMQWFDVAVPLFIMVYGNTCGALFKSNPLYLFFNKYINSEEITNILKYILEIQTINLNPVITVDTPSPDESKLEIKLSQDLLEYYTEEERETLPKTLTLTIDEVIKSKINPTKYLFKERAYNNPFKHFSKTILVLNSDGIHSGVITDAGQSLNKVTLTKHTTSSDVDKSIKQNIENLKNKKNEKLEELFSGENKDVLSVLPDLHKDYMPLLLESVGDKTYRYPLKLNIRSNVSITSIEKTRKQEFEKIDDVKCPISANILCTINQNNMTNDFKDDGTFTAYPRHWFLSKVSVGIIYDRMVFTIQEFIKDKGYRQIKLSISLPIFIMVAVAPETSYLFFNKYINSQEIINILKCILGINNELTLTPNITVSDPLPYVDKNGIQQILDVTSKNNPLYVAFEQIKIPFNLFSKTFLVLKSDGIYSGVITTAEENLDTVTLTKHSLSNMTESTFSNSIANLNKCRATKFKHDLIKKDVSVLPDLYKDYIPTMPKGASFTFNDENGIYIERIGKERTGDFFQNFADFEHISANILCTIDEYMDNLELEGGMFATYPRHWFLTEAQLKALPQEQSEARPQEQSEARPQEQPEALPQELPQEQSEARPQEQPEALPQELPQEQSEARPQEQPEALP